jgi:hypothetical protein
MTQAKRQIVRVKAGGLIEVQAPELAPGTVAEVIVLTEGEAPAGADRTQTLAGLFKQTQALAQARAVSEEEIAAEIAAYRARRA